MPQDSTLPDSGQKHMTDLGKWQTDAGSIVFAC